MFKVFYWDDHGWALYESYETASEAEKVCCFLRQQGNRAKVERGNLHR